MCMSLSLIASAYNYNIINPQYIATSGYSVKRRYISPVCSLTIRTWQDSLSNNL